MSIQPIRNSNLNIRITPLQKQVIAKAAELKQTTLSNFVLQQAYEAAQNVIVEQRYFKLSKKEWQQFYDALDAPPKSNPRLKKLFSQPSVFERKA